MKDVEVGSVSAAVGVGRRPTTLARPVGHVLGTFRQANFHMTSMCPNHFGVSPPMHTSF